MALLRSVSAGSLSYAGFTDSGVKEECPRRAVFDFGCLIYLEKRAPKKRGSLARTYFFGQGVPDTTESDRLKILGIRCGEFLNTKVPKGEAQPQIDDPAKRKRFLPAKFPHLVHDGG